MKKSLPKNHYSILFFPPSIDLLPSLYQEPFMAKFSTLYPDLAQTYRIQQFCFQVCHLPIPITQRAREEQIRYYRLRLFFLNSYSVCPLTQTLAQNKILALSNNKYSPVKNVNDLISKQNPSQIGTKPKSSTIILSDQLLLLQLSLLLFVYFHPQSMPTF